MGILKQTTEQYKEKVYNKHKDKVEILSEYNGGTEPINILYHCEKHGDTYKTINAKNVLSKTFQPCKLCDLELKSEKALNLNKDKEYHYIRLKEYCKSKNGELISTEWITAKTLYEMKCENPEHPIFKSRADGIINKQQWCPYCCGRKGDFNNDIKDIVELNNGTLLTEYINATTHVKVKCNIHNYIWDIMPLNIKKGRWCPVCSLPYSEKVVYDYLLNNNYKFQIQYTFDDLIGNNNEKLKYDFAILNCSNKLLGILEVDDSEHRGKPKQLRRILARERDKIKNDYCKINNINLFHLDYYNNKNFKDYEWYYNYIHNKLGKFLTEIINIKIS